MEVRLLNTDVDSDGNGDFGGKDYVTAGNAPQIGNATSITILNTDTNSTAHLLEWLFGLKQV